MKKLLMVLQAWLSKKKIRKQSVVKYTLPSRIQGIKMLLFLATLFSLKAILMHPILLKYKC